MGQEPVIHSKEFNVADEELAVRELLQRLNEAWGNTDAYVELFTEDADYVAFDGSRVKGRKGIEEMHRPLFERFMKDSRLVGQDQSTTVRFLTPDVALIHSKGAVIRAHQKSPSRRAISVPFVVAVKREGRWLITAFQNTRYRPFDQTFLGKVVMFLNKDKSR